MHRATIDSPLPAAVATRPSRFRFRLRTLLGITLAVGLALGAFVLVRDRAQRQEAFVSRIRSAGAGVWYDYGFAVGPDGEREIRVTQSPLPEWLVASLGPDWFHTPRRLQTPLELPDRFDTFDRNLLREALEDGPEWWDLDLCSHTLRDGDLALVGREPELETLFFDRVVLPDQNLRPLAPLDSLRSLGFRAVPLQQCDLRAVAELPKLRKLRFIQCELSNAQLAALPRLEGLIRFDVDGVTADGTDYHWLRSLPNVDTLCLQNVAIGDADIAHLQGLRRLKHLHLSNTKFTGRLPEGARLPSSLELLNLTGSPVETCAWVSELPNLTSLALGDQPLAEDELRELRWPPKLEHLWLAGQEVDAEILGELAKLPSLRHLTLSKHGADPAAVAEFQTKCPQCQVGLVR